MSTAWFRTLREWDSDAACPPADVHSMTAQGMSQDVVAAVQAAASICVGPTVPTFLVPGALEFEVRDQDGHARVFGGE